MMELDMNCLALPLALILDLLIGDPVDLPHPIRWMGRAILFFEPRFRRLPLHTRQSGLLFALFLISGTWATAWFILAVAGTIHPLVETGLGTVMIYYGISITSLRKSALAVGEALQGENLSAAREKLSHIVGRDVQRLDSAGVSRAAVESVAENFVDGIVSPLFFALIGGAPLCMAFKMVSTLDSMVGYKDDAYIDFGKAAARIDDVANFIPARLSVPLISLAAQWLGGRGKETFRTALADGRAHASPNSGRPEAAFAGALGIRLGGPNYYGGRLVDKPFIGARFGEADVRHIEKACGLMLLSALIWAGLACGLQWL